MSRKVFYSFHYELDCWRVAQIKQMGAIEGQRLLSSNEWEQIERQPDGIRRWINAAMQGKSCVVVLIGQQTYTRPWVDYEIRRGWEEGKGVLGVHIHGLRNRDGYICAKGPSPFGAIRMKSGLTLANHVPVFDPPGADSKQRYSAIERELPAWIEYAIKVRQNLNRAA